MVFHHQFESVTYSDRNTIPAYVHNDRHCSIVYNNMKPLETIQLAVSRRKGDTLSYIRTVGYTTASH